MQVRASIDAAHLQEGDSMDAHIAGLRGLFRQMRELGQPVSDDSQKLTLLRSLPPLFAGTREVFMVGGQTLPQVVEGLQSIVQSRGLNFPVPSSSSGERAFAVQGAEVPSSFRGKCWDCCGVGHSAGQLCPNYLLRVKTFGDNKTEGLYQYYKKLEANVAEVSPESVVPIVPVVSSSEGVQAMFASAADWSLPPMPTLALCVTALAASSSQVPAVFYLDSGCSLHMTSLRGVFTSFRELLVPVSVSGIGGTSISATGVGEVVIPTVAPEGLVWTTLRDVLYVPKLKDVGRAVPAIPALARGNPAPKFQSGARARACMRELREFAGNPHRSHQCGFWRVTRAFPHALMPAACL
ncbi:hypothetical protein BDV93DRAFT_564988 [Ceratobasidium sp. AG-I]|nr:hypothetical protein BDV93DRAFT_564988 [Ceratobasidium sp. AG-I]